MLSSPLMYTPPFFSSISNLAKGSRAGASSTSPEATLKQARIDSQYAHTEWASQVRGLTSVPSAGYSSIGAQDPQLQGCSVMGAVGTHSMSRAIHIGQQDLAIFNSFHLHFALFSALQVELGEPLDLVFLCHDSSRSGESRYWEVNEP